MATKDEIRAELERLGADSSDATKPELEARLADAQADGAKADADNEQPELTDEQKAAALGDDPEGQIKATGVDDGFLGTKVDPRPNEDYSLESGPSSPSALEGMQTAAAQRVEDLEASSK